MNVDDFDNVQLIKLLVYGKGTSQKAVCEKIGANPVSFSQTIHKGNLKFTDLQKICKELGCKISID